jgi:hypothetical protein
VRPELARAWRRFLAVVGLIVVALVSVVVWSLPYARSPLRLIDPSYGPHDAALCEALERALNDGVDPPARPGQFLHEVALQLEPITEQEFRRRAATVPGWDQLVAYPPYQRGEELTLDPAISSWWLKRQLRNTDGFETEHFLELLVVRDQKVVGSLILETDLEIDGVIARSP